MTELKLNDSLFDDPKQLFEVYSQQSQNLSLEIIDYLIQWENEGDISAERAHDTSEVVSTLNSVENELLMIDEWLSFQINKLESTKKDLSLIENESQALETSYQNITTIQNVVEFIVSNMSISPSEEKILASVDKIFDRILSTAPELKGVDKVLLPLVSVGDRLCLSLSTNQTELAKKSPVPKFSQSQWDQLLRLVAISSQHQTLAATAQAYTAALSDKLSACLSRLADSMAAAEAPSSSSSSGRVRGKGKASHSIAPRSLDLSELSKYALVHEQIPVHEPGSGFSPPSLPLIADGGTLQTGSDKSIGVELNALRQRKQHQNSIFTRLSLSKDLIINDYNGFLEAQIVFHSLVRPFAPLVRQLGRLDARVAQQFCLNYSSAVAGAKFYGPLMKSLSKQLRPLLLQQKQRQQRRSEAAGLASAPFARISGRPCAPLQIAPQPDPAARGGAGGLLLLPWSALGLLLALLLPLIAREELALERLALSISTGDSTISAVESSKTEGSEEEEEGEGYDQTVGGSGGGGRGSDHTPDKSSRSQLGPALPSSSAETGTGSAAMSLLLRMTQTALASFSAPNLIAASIYSAQPPDAVAVAGMLALVLRCQVDCCGMSFDEVSMTSSASAGAGEFTAAAPPGSLQSPVESGVAESSRSFIRWSLIGEGEAGEDGDARQWELISTSPVVRSLLASLRRRLVDRLSELEGELAAWLATQKKSPKLAGAASPVRRLPSHIFRVMSVLGGQKIARINEYYFRLTTSVLQWIEMISKLNKKYELLVIIHNFGYLYRCLTRVFSENNALYPHIATLLSQMQARYIAAEDAYVDWMIAYQFPLLSALGARLAGAREGDELGLFAKRADLLAVLKESESRRLVEGFKELALRLDKHFIGRRQRIPRRSGGGGDGGGGDGGGGEEDGGEKRNELWARIVARMRDVADRADVAASYYQLVPWSEPLSGRIRLAALKLSETHKTSLSSSLMAQPAPGVGVKSPPVRRERGIGNDEEDEDDEDDDDEEEEEEEDDDDDEDDDGDEEESVTFAKKSSKSKSIFSFKFR